MSLAVEAFAKVNLSLVVLGRRDDGFHELDTLFQTIDLSDRLVLSEAEGLTLEVDDPAVPADGRNLVLRAAEALREEARISRGAAITLRKGIPAGGGLGGGSSDAAAALVGLRALWGLDVGLATLERIGTALGSDVPFFLHGGTARGTGRGERIEPLPDAPSRGVVLLLPPFGVSTAEVFGRLGAPRLTASGAVSNLSNPGPERFPDRNDLEPAAEAQAPELRRLRMLLQDAGALRARLSGSGSTVFGLFPDVETARAAADRIMSAGPGARVRVAATLGRDEFRARTAPRGAEPGEGRS